MSKKVVAVSGGFDPIHIGHVRMMQEAKKLGDELIVFLNSDDFLIRKKGKPFMPFDERKELIEAFGCVDQVIPVIDIDHTVCETLRKYKPDIFVNGGDRKSDDIPEYKICRELGIEMVFEVGRGGKVQSSSDLVRDFHEFLKKNEDAQIFNPIENGKAF